MAATPDWTIRPEGDHALIVELGATLTPETGARCLALAQRVRQERWPGVTDVVPALTTVTLHYQPDAKVNYDALAARLETLLAAGLTANNTARRTVEIPVCYGGEHGPDLEDVARACGVTPEAVVALHTAPGARVYALGFAPGLPYIGVHDEKLNLPRRATPRTLVPQGSVAIANRQTTIYVTASPGGWHIIGTTPLQLFDHRQDPPTLLAPGDDLRFVPIDADEFDRIRAAQKAQSTTQETQP